MLRVEKCPKLNFDLDSDLGLRISDFLGAIVAYCARVWHHLHTCFAEIFSFVSQALS